VSVCFEARGNGLYTKATSLECCGSQRGKHHLSVELLIEKNHIFTLVNENSIRLYACIVNRQKLAPINEGGKHF
jgi:hypothetical protein